MTPIIGCQGHVLTGPSRLMHCTWLSLWHFVVESEPRLMVGTSQFVYPQSCFPVMSFSQLTASSHWNIAVSVWSCCQYSVAVSYDWILCASVYRLLCAQHCSSLRNHRWSSWIRLRRNVGQTPDATKSVRWLGILYFFHFAYTHLS